MLSPMYDSKKKTPKKVSMSKRGSISYEFHKVNYGVEVHAKIRFANFAGILTDMKPKTSRKVLVSAGL